MQIIFKLVSKLIDIKLFFQYYKIDSIDAKNNFKITYGYYNRQYFQGSPLNLIHQKIINKFSAIDAFIIGFYAAQIKKKAKNENEFNKGV